MVLAFNIGEIKSFYQVVTALVAFAVAVSSAMLASVFVQRYGLDLRQELERRHEEEQSLQQMTSEQRAPLLSGDVFSDIQDRMNLFRFHGGLRNTGLDTNQASIALTIARSIVEEVEEDYSARKRLGIQPEKHS
jgi:hypothetical protein